MKHCTNCGAEMQDDIKFCPACGAAQVSDEQVASQQPQEQQPYYGQAPQQPYYGQPQQPYAQQPYVPQGTASVKPFPALGLVGMIFGILAIILTWFLWYLGVVFSIVGLILSAIGVAKRNNYRLAGLAIAGLVCSIVALVLTIVSIILAFAIVAAVM